MMRSWVGVLILVLVPSIASADVLEVCATCAHTTIADGLAAAGAGDVVEVASGTWAECFLEVPAGVWLAGEGPTTVVDGTACGFGTLVTVGDDGGLDSLRLHPDPVDGTGVFFAGSGTAWGLEVRGGYVLLVAGNDTSAAVHVESSVLVGDSNTLSGIEGGFVTWTLQQGKPSAKVG